MSVDGSGTILAFPIEKGLTNFLKNGIIYNTHHHYVIFITFCCKIL